MTTPIDVRAWTDLLDLADHLDTQAERLAAIFSYARRWVCQRRGFEPSALCLLRPLGDLLGLVDEALLDLQRRAVADLVDLSDAVDVTAIDLRDTDRGVAADLSRRAT